MTCATRRLQGVLKRPLASSRCPAHVRPSNIDLRRIAELADPRAGRDGEVGARPFSRVGGAGGGQDAPGARARPARARRRARLDSVVIACPTAPLTRQWARAASALGLELAPDCRHRPARRGASTGSPSRTRGSPRRRVRWAKAARAGTAGRRRRGASPRRGARLGRGVRHGVPRARALAAALRDAVSLRRDADPRRPLRRATGSPSPTSPTPMPRRCATASAGRSASSPTTGRCHGAAAMT